jgi:hypothetical protein
VVGGGGQLVGAVAEAEFGLAEELPVGGIDEVLGGLAEEQLGGGPELVHDGADAGFAPFRGGQRG